MGQLKWTQLVILIFFLALTAGALRLFPSAVAVDRSIPLVQALDEFGEWRKVYDVPLAPDISRELQLDDYVLQRYVARGEEVELYVGFYATADKTGGSHDPLVCFPGQGWMVTDLERGSVRLSGVDGETLEYATFRAARGGETTLVVYWYQAGLRTATGPFGQKLQLLRSKLLDRVEGNAFVRFSTPVKGKEFPAAKARLLAFATSFYPSFQRFVAGE